MFEEDSHDAEVSWTDRRMGWVELPQKTRNFVEDTAQSQQFCITISSQPVCGCILEMY